MFKMPDWIYDVLKLLVTVILPAASTLYTTLAKIYNWPYAGEVAQTVAAVCTFIGTVIGISSYYYWNDQEVQGDDHGDVNA